jgi:hypothetical protein
MPHAPQAAAAACRYAPSACCPWTAARQRSRPMDACSAALAISARYAVIAPVYPDERYETTCGRKAFAEHVIGD